MNVKTDTNGYVTDYALIGSVEGGVEIDAPADLAHFETHCRAYRIRDGVLEYDGQKDTEIEEETLRQELRKRREAECFSVINRGWLWYDTLSDDQISELRAWYRDWLDVTDTMTVPAEPSWINTTL